MLSRMVTRASYVVSDPGNMPWQDSSLPMPKVTVRIDPATCITAANCVGVAPDLFQIGSETYAEVLDSSGRVRGNEYTFDATPKEMELLEEAMDSCPTKAISMTE